MGGVAKRFASIFVLIDTIRIPCWGLLLLIILNSSALLAQCSTQGCNGLTLSTDISKGTAPVDNGQKYSILTAGPTLSLQGDRFGLRTRGLMSILDRKSTFVYSDAYGVYQLNRNGTFSVSVDAEGGLGSYRSTMASRYARTSVRIGLSTLALGEISIAQASDTATYISVGGSVSLTLQKNNFSLNPMLGYIYTGKKTARLASIGTLYNSSRVQIGSRIGITADSIDRITSSTTPWGYIYGNLQLLESIGLTFSAGKVPADIDRGIDAGKIMSMGLRVTHFRKHLNKRSKSNGQLLSIKVEDAAEVEIRASFTSWRPVSMHQNRDGAWTLPLKLPPGLYSIAIRVNKGQWHSPPGLVVSTDDFGEEVGLLVVR